MTRRKHPTGPKERIVASAARLFMQQGFAATSVRQIGEDAQVSQSSLYYHIDSKAQLLKLLHESFLTDMLAQLAAADSANDTATEKLRAMIHVVISIIEHHHAEVTVFLREGHALPRDLRKKVIAQRDLVDERFDGVLRLGVSSGEFRSDLDVHMARLAILGMCNWAYQWFTPDGQSSQTIGDYFAGLALRGVSADCESGAAERAAQRPARQRRQSPASGRAAITKS